MDGANSIGNSFRLGATDNPVPSGTYRQSSSLRKSDEEHLGSVRAGFNRGRPVQNNSQNSDSNVEAAEYLSPHQFADYSGLSLATVRRYLERDKLPKCQPGGPRCRILIPRSALDACLPTTSESGDDAKHSAQTPKLQSQSKTSINSPQSSGRKPVWIGRK